MSEDELLKQLEEHKKKKDEEYTKLKGMIAGLKLANLGEMKQAFLLFFEFIIDNFNDVRDQIIGSLQQHLLTSKKVKSLEERVKQLEETLKKLEEWK